MKALLFSILPVLASSPAVASGQPDPAATHELQLLQAQLEDLSGRLVVDRPGRFLRPGPELPAGLGVKSSTDEPRRLAGIQVQRTTVRLEGDPRMVLRWLADLREAGFALTPPWDIGRRAGALVVSVTLWHATPGAEGLQISAAVDELNRLKDNLLWLQAQRTRFEPLLRVLEVIIDGEVFRLDSASWLKGALHVAGRFPDPASERALRAELGARVAVLVPRPRLSLAFERITATTGGSQPGLDMADLDPADALLLVAQVARREVVHAGPSGTTVSGSVRARDGYALLSGLFAKLGTPHRWSGEVAVSSARLAAEPPAADMFSARPISIFFNRAPPGRVIRLLTDVSRLDLVPGDWGSLRLTVALQGHPVRDAARLAFWALGASPAGHGKLVAPLPRDTGGTALGDGSGPVLDLAAAEAPLHLLVAELLGDSPVRECLAPPGGVTLRVRRAPADVLLNMLLAAQGRRVIRGDSALWLVPLGVTIPNAPEDCREPAQAPRPQAPARLAAVLRGMGEPRALVAEAAGYRWLRRGQSLQDGREVRRVHAGRVVLRNRDGRHESLLPGSADPGCRETPCPEEQDLSKYSLVRLRLAATAVLPRDAAAVIEDPTGRTHLVRPGDLLGTRCGRLLSVRPGVVTISLGCRRPYDPEETSMAIGPRIDSGNAAR